MRGLFDDSIGNGVDAVLDALGRGKSPERATERLRRMNEAAGKQASQPPQPQPQQSQALPQIRSRKLDGHWYLRAEDVLIMLRRLDSQKVQPVVDKLAKLIELESS